MSDVDLSNRALLGRLFGLVRHYRRGCFKLVVLQLVLLGVELAGLASAGLALDTLRSALGGETTAAAPAALSARGWVFLLASAVLAAGCVRAVLSYAYAVASARFLQQEVVVDLRTAVYNKLHRLSHRFHGETLSGSLINRVTGDAQAVRMFIDGVVLQLAILVLSLAVYLTYMLRIDAVLTLLCLATTPALWAISWAFCRSVRPAYAESRDLMDRLILVLTETVRGIEVAKAFSREEGEVAKFRNANAAVRDQKRRIFRLVSLYSPAVEMLLALNMLALLGYGGYLVIQGRMPLGTGLIVFSGLLQRFSAQITKMTTVMNSVQESLAGARRVFEVLDAPIEVAEPRRPRRLVSPRGRIAMEGVRFGYDPASPVLHGVTFQVEPGECVVVLGGTGQGKSTLLQLVPRFHDPQDGRVLVDGRDVRTLALADLRQSIGVVFQENFLFSDTVAANIGFGRADATREQIERAAELAAAGGFIGSLPGGYDTLLGEGGKDLSGGQRQRLAIARALVREPQILLLDDPTAAVDPQTEREILRDIRRAMAGRTTLLATHRPGALEFADRVLVLDRGRVTAFGPPAEVLGGVVHFQRVAGEPAERLVVQRAA